MMTTNIYTDGTVTVNARHVGNVRQERFGTVMRNTKGAVIALPKDRYALTTESGLEQFKADLQAALAV